VTVPRVMEPLLRPQDASAGVTTMAVGPPVFWILAVVENSHPLASLTLTLWEPAASPV